MHQASYPLQKSKPSRLIDVCLEEEILEGLSVSGEDDGIVVYIYRRRRKWHVFWRIIYKAAA